MHFSSQNGGLTGINESSIVFFFLIFFIASRYTSTAALWPGILLISTTQRRPAIMWRIMGNVTLQNQKWSETKLYSKSQPDLSSDGSCWTILCTVDYVTAVTPPARPEKQEAWTLVVNGTAISQTEHFSQLNMFSSTQEKLVWCKKLSLDPSPSQTCPPEGFSGNCGLQINFTSKVYQLQ